MLTPLRMITQEKIDKQFLPISIWRPLLILSIVIGHSFAIYSGAWQYDFESGVDYIEAYGWLNPFFISFQLEAFFFISGYLFWMGRYAERELTLRSYYQFIKKKFARLYVPSIVFSLLYLYFFTSPIEPSDLLGALLLGKGHIWFLPTIFWCFAIHRLLAKWGHEHLELYLILAFLAVYAGAVIYHLLPDAFTYLLCRVTRYYFFFVLGASIRNTRIDNRLRGALPHRGVQRYTILFALLFLVLWGVSMLDNWHLVGDNNIDKLIDYAVSPVCALMGTLAMYTSWLLMERYSYSFRVARAWVYLSSISFGVYVVHQFILVEVVDNHLLQLQSLVRAWAIPFTLIIIGVLGSIAVVEAFKKVL